VLLYVDIVVMRQIDLLPRESIPRNWVPAPLFQENVRVYLFVNVAAHQRVMDRREERVLP
jgi:hypothetical protein